jgi:hypothetical protein
MKNPFIARDTKTPLCAFGYQIAEDGSVIREEVARTDPKLMDYADFKLICDIGYDGCIERQYFGVVDRVDRTRLKAIESWNAGADDFNKWDQCDSLEHMKRMLAVAGVKIAYEDELPDGVDYDTWYQRSCVWCGVRVGPST